MTSSNKRTDTASRVIAASPQALYQAFVNPTALAAWLPPSGMSCRIDLFEPWEGGAYRMTLTYKEPTHANPGKTSEHADVVSGRFVKLLPNTRIVQSVDFDSEDPAFAGTMTMTWTFTAVPTGTEVAILCENVPDGIRPEDHDAGLTETLKNLAAFVE